NDISATKFEKFGKEKVKTLFYIDRIHTSIFGARVNCESAIEGIRNYKGLALAKYLKPVEKDEVTGAGRREGLPMLFTIGDSTVKNEDKDENGMWGWGSVISELFDSDKIVVENDAMAGRSARTFLDEGRWDKVYNALQPGDFVLIQFGHNDLGDINVGKARGELPGSGDESKVFRMETNNKNEVVYTFGWYLRKFIMDAKEKGAIPIVMSHTPRNKFDGGLIERNTDTFGKWTREAAERAGAYYIDINQISGDKIQKMANEEGLLKVAEYYNHDHTHTSKTGARMNAQSIAEGLQATGCPLKDYLK
ncbi:MAG: GDSL-type esterase/lipase family protein, partial [Prevotellaceae bacterium]|nr:GDSL-type esterase/lipase family protein [Prevotellaceae bacterium]